MARRNREHQPVNPFHPGEVLLEEFIEPADISQAAFAGKLAFLQSGSVERTS